MKSCDKCGRMKGNKEHTCPISAWNKGKKMSEKYCENLRGLKRHKGAGIYIRSEEAKKNIRLSHTGEKNPNWKGGISSIRARIRSSIEYKLWRDACFARDGYTCQKTGQIGGELVVHHIQNFAQYPELRFAIDNGVTLSKKSHQDFHKKYGIKNNTREQLEKFLDMM